MILLASCGQPSEETVQTAIVETQLAEESEPSSAPVIPTNTVSDCYVDATYKTEWAITFCDNFVDNRNGWDLGRSGDELSRSNFDISNGKLVVDFTGAATTGYTTGVIQWIPITEADNFAITLTGEMDSVYRNLTWGISFRNDSNGSYIFEISNEGVYSLIKFKGGDWSWPISAKSHRAIKWDDKNTITITGDGDYFEFYINGEFINSYETDDLDGSGLAFTIWMAEGVTAVYEFDDLLVRAK
ncbi:MAG TPA: hypothetical protein G4N92_06140 [Anaerolineae bacterium]|nr:hypothetical protein [Anaerolineae bacterium]